MSEPVYYSHDNTFSVAVPKYDCPKHGEVTEYVSIAHGGELDGKWCQRCFAEMVSANCQRLTPK